MGRRRRSGSEPEFRFTIIQREGGTYGSNSNSGSDPDLFRLWLYYSIIRCMTLTVRTDKHLRRALEDRAQSTGKTLSEVVREILEEAVTARPVAERAGHLKGRLNLPAPAEDWRRQIKERSWRR